MVGQTIKSPRKFRFFIHFLLGLSLLSFAGRSFEEYPPGPWETIIENQEFTSSLHLDKGDDNTLIIGSTFRNIDGDAITLRNVSNVYIKDCVIESVSGNGIVLRSTGRTHNITIDGCTIRNTTESGILAKQNQVDNVDHTALVIQNNTLADNGLDDLDHGIYVMTQDATVRQNEIFGSSGNGVSIRSSGVVSGNSIWDTSKSCIRYFNDNATGPSRTLLIENNICYLTSAGSQSPAFSLLWSEQTQPDWIVENFIIRFNTIAVFTDQRMGIAVESKEFDEKNTMVYGNIVINTQDVNAAIQPDYIDYLSSNYVSESLNGFRNGKEAPFDFHITMSSPAVDYANKETDFPSLDADGQPRPAGDLDAGAYQIERSFFLSMVGNTSQISGPLLFAATAALVFFGIRLLGNRKKPTLVIRPKK